MGLTFPYALLLSSRSKSARQITEGWMKEMVHELDFHREADAVSQGKVVAAFGLSTSNQYFLGNKGIRVWGLEYCIGIICGLYSFPTKKQQGAACFESLIYELLSELVKRAYMGDYIREYYKGY